MDSADEIKEARTKRGLSQADLARLANTTQQTVNRIERRLTRHSRAEATIREVLRLAPLRATTAAATAPEPTTERMKPTAAMPIFGALDGNDGTIVVTGDVVGSMPRFAPTCYATYITSSAYAPAFRYGELAIINPALPPRAGDTVIVFAVDGRSARIAEFAGSTSESWELSEIGAKRFTLPKSDYPMVQTIQARVLR